MAKKKVNKKANISSSKKQENSNIYAFIASFFTIIGFIIAMILWREDKKVMFYAKEGLVIFIGFIVAIILEVLPLIGEILYKICIIGLVILWIITWVYALMGEQKKTWIIGDLAEKLDF